MADTATTPKEPTEAEIKAAAKAAKEAEVKDLLKRFGLKKAWIDKAGGVHFDEAHVKKHVKAADVAAEVTVA